jgi:hypothetical protein
MRITDEPRKTEIEHFAGIVRRYCAWAENPLADVETEMQTARKLLAELHAVISLPDLETGDNIELEDITTKEWKSVATRFSSLPVDGYWLVFDPIKEQENDTVYTTVADDLADIYRDTKYGLRLFDAGHVAEAIWEWKFHYKIHWGWHLLGAQRVIHFWFFNHGDEDL